jgi:Pentapeptide repeats (8 copies)
MVDETEHTVPAAPPDAAVDDATPAPVLDDLPPLPLTATALAGKAKDLVALRDAVVDAASVGAGLWFSYLFVLLYLFIAAGSVTHKDLFLQSPVRLPFLNVDLPLLGFFWLGPLIFLIVHAYVLLHFVLLAGKVGDFDTELREQIPDEDVRRRLRRQLPSNIFVQFLAGSREVRTGVMGFMLRLIAQISLVIGPIALLVFFEPQFLPYHDEAITWWHRIAVVADIVLLWLLWPSIARGETVQLKWRDLRRGKILGLAVASLMPVLLVAVIATFPGEWLDDNFWKKIDADPRQVKQKKDEKETPWRWASPHQLLVAGEVDFAARKPKSLWSNILVLPGFDAIDHAKFDSDAKIEAVSETISLRARHLEGAVLIGAKLRRADFTGALLQGAKLDSADLTTGTVPNRNAPSSRARRSTTRSSRALRSTSRSSRARL